MTCQQCTKDFKLRRAGTVNKYCSRHCYWASMKGIQPLVMLPIMVGADNPMWKDRVSYQGVHKWLYRNFGSAKRCENPSCEGRSKRFEWALVEGKEYEKVRSNFKELCSVCHHAYDRIAEKRWGRG